MNYIDFIYIFQYMESERIVIKRPRTFAEESFKRGSTYYDYENNINVIPR